MEFIEKLAREHGTGGWQTLDDMVRFGKAVAAAEREACAKVCETGYGGDAALVGRSCATKIRRRSNAGGKPQSEAASD